jgi:aspartate beta-hydroxylase
MLDEGRLANPDAETNFPHTMKTVRELLGDDPLIAGAGVVKASWLAPGAHIAPHCGPHNLRLRLHLGLVVPEPINDGTMWRPRAGIRVGNATVRSWTEGIAIIFDESFEHSVYNDGSTPRLVLIVDVWHPSLTMEKRSQLLALRERWKADERSYIDGLHQAPN